MAMHPPHTIPPLVIERDTTRRDRVLKALEYAAQHQQLRFQSIDEPARDGWVDGYLLCHPGIGGSEGLRRVRELRAADQPIEVRPHPVHGRTTRQYRIRRPGTLF